MFHILSITSMFHYSYVKKSTQLHTDRCNCVHVCFILFLQAGALVIIYKDGSVLVTHGGTEMGQGLHTKMIQVPSTYTCTVKYKAL